MKWKILAERLERNPNTMLLAELVESMHTIECSMADDETDFLDSDEVYKAFERIAERAA